MVRETNGGWYALSEADVCLLCVHLQRIITNRYHYWQPYTD